MYRPHCVRSVLTTSVKILPYRPPARLIRAKHNIARQNIPYITMFSLTQQSNTSAAMYSTLLTIDKIQSYFIKFIYNFALLCVSSVSFLSVAFFTSVPPTILAKRTNPSHLLDLNFDKQSDELERLTVLI